MSTWKQLEFLPEVLTKLLHKWGVSSAYGLFDLMVLFDGLRGLFAHYVEAIILVVPVTEAYENHRKAEDERLKAEPEVHDAELFFTRQVSYNSSSSVAIINAIANIKDIPLVNGVLKNFIVNAQSLTPQERSEALEQDKQFTLKQQEMTEKVKINEFNFVTLINFHGELYELDGRKSFPIKHRTTNEEDFLAHAAILYGQFLTFDPDHKRFRMLALTTFYDL